jgi:hypothetical protein
MRSVEQIISVIEQLKESDFDEMKPAKKKAVFNRINFLITCQRYLESKPSEDFLRKEESRLSRRIDLIDKGLHAYCQSSVSKSAKRDYEKENGIPTLKEQLKTIKYLLNK